jgi:hypothetical protein
MKEFAVVVLLVRPAEIEVASLLGTSGLKLTTALQILPVWIIFNLLKVS